MAKAKTAYVCNDCGSDHANWQGQRNDNWEQLFEDYAQPKKPQQPHYQEPNLQASASLNNTSIREPYNPITASRSSPMTDDWRPSDNMVELIMATICPNGDYLNAQLISFTSHFHGQYNPNWDQQFKKWVNNGWNVYGHKNNFGKNNKEGRGFVEKHTDKSWREGL